MKSRFTFVATICLLWLHLSASAAHSRTWHVNVSGTGDAPTIEAAIDSASAGDTVSVAPGFYFENTLEIDKNLHLLSERGARETTIQMIPFSNYNLHVVALSGLSSNSSVQGFTIRGGRGSPLDSGAGIDLLNSSSLIKDNIIFDNETQMGGGISCVRGSPIIRRNIIYGNRGSQGCGIYVYNSSAVIDSNTIAFNGIECGGGLGCGFGGAIFVQSNVPVVVINSLLVFNHAVDRGGIFAADASGGIDFRCNLVYGNEPTNYAGALADQTGVNGNLSLDPQFCASKPDSSGNFFLQSDSACLPTNNPNGPLCGLIGALGAGCGTTNTERASWGKVKDIFRR